MSRKLKPRQLTFVFADSPQGVGNGKGADASALDSLLMHAAKVSQRAVEAPLDPGTDGSQLLERVARLGNLAAALDKVVRNQGAPGVDGQSVQAVNRSRDTFLPLLRDALLAETYVPGDVRRVWIPKPSGGHRGLGIPNVVDRVVQQAVLQILEPIWEPTFHPSSHGFRPGRGAVTAIPEAAGYVKQGLRYTVDIDLSNFFDRVNHQRLLSRLGQRVSDRRLLRIVRLMLKANVALPDGTRVLTEEGTPQGGPLSPLLSNIVLDELDQELARRGLRFVRYADDCNVFVGSERAGHRVMASIRRFIEGRLRLKVNDEKSAVDLAGRRHFLGFRIGASPKGWLTVTLSERSEKRLAAKIRELTPRNWGGSFTECARRLNSYLRGWSSYFRLCTAEIYRTLKHVDAHIRRRLRALIVCQRKRPRFLYRYLRAHGASHESARAAAFNRRGPWRTSRAGALHTALPNKWFEARVLSLHSLHVSSRYDWRPLLQGLPT